MTVWTDSRINELQKGFGSQRGIYYLAGVSETRSWFDPNTKQSL